MSAIASGLNNQAVNSNAASSTSGGGFNDLDSDEFLDIILTELTNQDPLAPNDTQALLEQLSSLRNIESQLSLEESLEQLVLQNSLSQAGSLIGRTVEGTANDGAQLRGTVESIRVNDGETTLQLDTGRQLNMSALSLITDAGL
ncbi:MAG: flagellar hook capping FlgD N-terminal domain-containing protein [Planctomycetota bacterium]